MRRGMGVAESQSSEARSWYARISLADLGRRIRPRNILLDSYPLVLYNSLASFWDRSQRGRREMARLAGVRKLRIRDSGFKIRVEDERLMIGGSRLRIQR